METFEASSSLHAGDWVEVRSEDEILATLDKRGQLDGLPFMPEMLKYCGQRFQVWKRAHKTCDTVNKTGGRRVSRAVHLQELRCDGLAHGGCQAGCLLYWKDAWIKPVVDSGKSALIRNADAAIVPTGQATGCTRSGLQTATLADGKQEESAPVFVCQATRLPYASTPLPWWDIRQYWEDYISGNVGLRRMLSSFGFAGFYRLTIAGIGVGRPSRWLYDKIQNARGSVPFPRRSGTVPPGEPTPSHTLNLQPGELVRVKSFPEILSTLDHSSKNRGLYFDCEEVPFCGGTYRVKSRVSRIINERTGKMTHFKTESVILDGVYCQARYSDRRLFCPRSIYPLWREVWLERLDTQKSEPPAAKRP